jgi:hypothetical protein
MTTSVIVAGARTPIGRLMGSLKDFSGTDLGAIGIALDTANVAAASVDYVIMGQVLTAGAGQMPARQAAAAAGIGWDVPALTVNKMCLSGLDAIALADQLIRAGEFEVVVAGGQQSMTKAPHLLMDSRAGYKYGSVTVLDHLAYDGLHDVFTDQPMGALTEQRSAVDQFTRAEQDEFAAPTRTRPARRAPEQPADRSDLAASSQGPRPDTGALAGRTRPRRDRADPHGVSRPATLRAAAHLRELLMVADKQICMFERWLIEHVAGITDSEHAKLIRRFATWDVLPRLRARAERNPLTGIKADSVPSHWL